MKTPHKHAAVAIAWLQDQSIKLEYKHIGWSEWDAQCGKLNPITHPCYEWRIKLEPKPDVVRYGIATRYFGKEVAESGDNIKVTFCGETGKLLKAEVSS